MKEGLSNFEFEGEDLKTQFVETENVADGVECDVYAFPEDSSKDLGIIRVEPGKSTPLQKVLDGTRTVEGHISGEGYLVVARPDQTMKFHLVGNGDKVQVDVNVGDLMQWHAGDSALAAYEVCIPPYQDGRYMDIE